MKETIEEARADLGMNQDELARAADLSLSTLQRILRGHKPLLKHSRALEAALGWESGSLAAVLNNGQPTLANESEQQDDVPDVDELIERLREEIKLHKDAIARQDQVIERLFAALDERRRSA